MTTPALKLVSFDLCPYVQRAAILLAEKGVPFERINVDLANKPDWFLQLSPLGKVPLLQVGEEVLFESMPIVEYIDEVYAPTLHPPAPLAKAKARAWMEVGSTILADLWIVETTADERAYSDTLALLKAKFVRLEAALQDGPYFYGREFSVVDAVFAPVFRYFDVFETMTSFDVLDGLPKVGAWRAALAARPSVKSAVTEAYPNRLLDFVHGKGGVLSRLSRS